MAAESEQERTKRRWQRTLFDGVARLYQDSRPGYPGHIVEFAVTTSELGEGSRVLEVGCGTGQLTESLARFGFSLTAIDIGASMIEEARRRLAGSAVMFEVSSFEELAAAEGSFDLIISGTAFHWIDPEVKFSKSARLLRPGGWLALVDSRERYDDPFGTALADMWVARSATGAAWVRPAAHAGQIASTGLFGTPVCQTAERRCAWPADVVIGLENTRATALSWPPETRREFTAELRQHLRDQGPVHLTQQTSVTMARALGRLK